MRRVIAAALFVAACGGKRSPPATPLGNTGGDAAGTPYDAFFERGVWKTDVAELPADVAAARAAIAAQPRPLLTTRPKAEEEKHEEEEGFGEMRKVSQAADGAWCVDWGSWGGDEGGGGICFAAGQGLTKLSAYWAGGSTKDDWIELVP